MRLVWLLPALLLPLSGLAAYLAARQVAEAARATRRECVRLDGVGEEARALSREMAALRRRAAEQLSEHRHGPSRPAGPRIGGPQSGVRAPR